MKPDYNSGGKGLPVAEFYPFCPTDGISVSVEPLGIRNIGIGKFRPLLNFPFASQRPIRFRVTMNYRGNMGDEFREFAIDRRDSKPGHPPIKEIHAENNQGENISLIFVDWRGHDDEKINYELWFPRMNSERKRIVYTKPIDSNYVPILIAGTLGGILIKLAWDTLVSLIQSAL